MSGLLFIVWKSYPSEPSGIWITNLAYCKVCLSYFCLFKKFHYILSLRHFKYVLLIYLNIDSKSDWRVVHCWVVEINIIWTRKISKLINFSKAAYSNPFSPWGVSLASFYLIFACPKGSITFWVGGILGISYWFIWISIPNPIQEYSIVG